MEKYKEELLKDWKGITEKELKEASTPGYPGESLTTNVGEPIRKTEFRKILGKLMWFTRKVMPECPNAIRELAMFMDNPGDEHWKAMTRLMGYIKKEPAILKLRKPWNLKVTAFVD